ncbi:MAG: D-2-hydroxyacid dehydrogenase [Lachnospiraceae bacterium]|nr:D-2-hydroxyacid dehydrogenase [Lachnospiraceae bacterium]
MKIVITDSKTVTNGDVSLDCFSDFGETKIYELTGEKLINERVRDADVLLVNKIPLNRETLRGADNLKYIGLFATGYNNIDLEYTNEKGITVCNAADYSTNAVAQHTFALIMEHYSRVSQYNSFVQNGEWIRSEVFSPFVYHMQEIAGKTIGIIGFGSIGKAVANIASAFGMNVLFYSRSKREHTGNAVQTDLCTLLSKSDIVTIHCPLNAESDKMCNAEFFAKMKSGALFINTARGGIVDEPALKNALENGKLGGAAIDVLTCEPMSDSCPLLGAKNLIITPHIAWAPTETRSRLIRIVYNNLKNYLNGNPTNVVSSN